MMSFDNVLIMEPNFITFFTPIRKVQYQTHFLLMSAFCSAQNLSIFYLEKMYIHLWFYQFFVQKQCINSLWYVSSKNYFIFFCAISLSLYDFSPGTVSKDSFGWLALETFNFIYCLWCIAYWFSSGESLGGVLLLNWFCATGC